MRIYKNDLCIMHLHSHLPPPLTYTHTFSFFFPPIVTMAETGEEWTEEQAAPELATVEVDAPEIMLFGKWPLEDIECRDISLTVSRY